MASYRPTDAPHNFSTQINPFFQGGWTPSSEQIPREYLVGQPPTTVVPLQSSYGALPLHASSFMQCTSASASTTLIRFTPRPPKNGQVINYDIIDHDNHVHYTVITEKSALTIVKDFERRPVALIEWTPVPSIDIRGNNGKKPLGQWLIQDPNYPNTQLMQWQGAWYSWVTEQDSEKISLYQSKSGRPIAIVRTLNPTFEIEFAPNVLKNEFLEPCIVAIIVIQWGNGHFG